MVSIQKKSQVESILELLKKNPSFSLVKINKITHQNLENLRKELRKTNSSIKVVKNTLFEKALNRAIVYNPLFKEIKKKFFPLRETTALLIFKKNWDIGLKTFFNFTKKENSLTFRFSILDNFIYGSEETEKIAALPSREELVAKLISSLKSPLGKFIYSLKYNTNRFVYLLQAKSKQLN